MKRVRMADVDGMEPAGVGHLPADLIQLLGKLDEIRAIQGEMQKDIKEIWKRVNAVEDIAAKMTQYQEDHDEVHRNMAAAEGDGPEMMAQTIATSNEQMIRQTQAQLNVMQEAISVLQKAIEDRVEPDTSAVRYKINRNQNGLIDSVVETR